MLLHHPFLQIFLPVTIISKMKRQRKALLLRNVASSHVSLVICRSSSWGVSFLHCWQGVRFPACSFGPGAVFDTFSGPSWRISRSSLYFFPFFLPQPPFFCCFCKCKDCINWLTQHSSGALVYVKVFFWWQSYNCLRQYVSMGPLPARSANQLPGKIITEATV